MKSKTKITASTVEEFKKIVEMLNGLPDSVSIIKKAELNIHGGLDCEIDVNKLENETVVLPSGVYDISVDRGYVVAYYTPNGDNIYVFKIYKPDNVDYHIKLIASNPVPNAPIHPDSIKLKKAENFIAEVCGFATEEKIDSKKLIDIINKYRKGQY